MFGVVVVVVVVCGGSGVLLLLLHVVLVLTLCLLLFLCQRLVVNMTASLSDQSFLERTGAGVGESDA